MKNSCIYGSMKIARTGDIVTSKRTELFSTQSTREDSEQLSLTDQSMGDDQRSPL